MDIKEIAQTLKLKMQDQDDGRFDIGEFAEALIAELAKQNEPVARVNGYYSGHPVIMPLVKYVFPVGLALYTFPPTAEQIANETAEACAKYIDSTNGNIRGVNTVFSKALRSGAWKEFK